MIFWAPLEDNKECDEDNSFAHNDITCTNNTCNNAMIDIGLAFIFLLMWIKASTIKK